MSVDKHQRQINML